ncbi:MAG TPA: hypothetical protein VJP02_10190 [Candidatus Sulfotelmatobacter sp.]|nr:hypothetical protein [Candidatus Sulfotelmatobacter sp.]
MRATRFALLCCFGSFLASLPVVAQQTSSAVQRDPQAITILTQALNVAGGAQILAGVQDFTGTGNVTYYSAGQQVQATVTVKGRGTSQFRRDATLPGGVSSAIVNNGTASVKESDGTVQTLVNQHADNIVSLNFPFPELAAALADPSVSIKHLGLVTKDGKQVHVVRLQETFPAKSDPSGMRSKLNQRDFFFDPSTFAVIGIQDKVPLKGHFDPRIPHEVVFSDYRRVNGILFPFSVMESIYGQRTFAMQLEQVRFNTGLTDSDFQQ